MLNCIAVCGPTASGKSKVVKSVSEWLKQKGFDVRSISLSQQAFLEAFNKPSPPSYVDAAKAIMKFICEDHPSRLLPVSCSEEVVVFERWFIDWIAYGLIDVISTGSSPFAKQFLSTIIRRVERMPFRHFLIILLRHPVETYGSSDPPFGWPQTRSAAYLKQSSFPGVWDAAAVIYQELVGDNVTIVKSGIHIKNQSDADMLAKRVLEQFFLV